LFAKASRKSNNYCLCAHLKENKMEEKPMEEKPMEEKPKEEVIVLNSEDEDYSDLPACGTTGDPAHKVKVVSSEKK